MKEKIEYISPDKLVPFKNHPFKLRNGEEKQKLKESIYQQGTIEPLIVRPLSSEDKYEVISGHRRLDVCKELKMGNIPVIVKELTDEQAISMMVDSNLHRENILPSEKAFAYKMKMDTIKKQGKRTDLTSAPVVQKWSVSEIANDNNESREQVRRYIRLTYLISELLELVDQRIIAFRPAVELSYLSKDEQLDLYETIQSEECTPSLSQAQTMKKLSSENNLDMDKIFGIMTQQKANQKEKISFEADELRKYFPKNYTDNDIKQKLLYLVKREKARADSYER